ncbi:CDP-glycerol glycerophosphotransferase family protein [Bacillus sp. BHET2]|uniref:CDP-glycerol glycerophosphotransferase family protein n=1 Tax=Bacillus sp. BHET2 TaxID=2583818 RepID=UPI001486170A|nr:CDP-glycerol glycerophosphotransferase family protein [Bacillus sp. BHET2]
MREIAITLYLAVFSIIFKLSQWFPLENKVTFVVSFSENNKSIYKEMIRQDLSCRTLFLTTEKMYSSFSKLEKSTTLLFEMKRPIDFLRSIYHLATSKIIFVDNYYGFLAKSNFKPGVECIQLWHANGAIKKFGLKDPSIKSRSEKAIQRFHTVYQRFSTVVVGSDAMTDIYKQAFGINDKRMVRTGIPRTDVFFDQSIKKKAEEKLKKNHPFLENKKVILYAPTYREDELIDAKLNLDLKKMADRFDEDYILLLKLHPAIKNRFEIPSDLSEFIYDFSNNPSMNEMLFITDILITDYSSIPFEYTLLNRPVIFYLYDLEDYKSERGVWDGFLEYLPGPIAENTDDIIRLIEENSFDSERIHSFADKWNQYSKGQSSRNVVDLVKGLLK